MMAQLESRMAALQKDRQALVPVGPTQTVPTTSQPKKIKKRLTQSQHIKRAVEYANEAQKLANVKYRDAKHIIDASKVHKADERKKEEERLRREMEKTQMSYRKFTEAEKAKGKMGDERGSVHTRLGAQRL